MAYNCCRFCGQYADDLLKYGTRHYAHPKCFLDAGKDLAELNKFQLERLPYFLIKERGLLRHVEFLLSIYAAAKRRRDDAREGFES